MSLCIIGDVKARSIDQSEVYFDKNMIDIDNDYFKKQIEDEFPLEELGICLICNSCHKETIVVGWRR